MVEHIVEQLNYAGDDEAGAYCEALLIRSGGKEYYIMHRGRSVHDGKKSSFLYEKIDYSDRNSLLKAFPGVYITGWKITDSQCGFDIPQKEFIAASRRGLESRLKIS